MSEKEGQIEWRLSTRIAFRIVFPFTVLFILTFPTPPDVLPDPAQWLVPLFESLVRWVGDNLLGVECSYSERLISDSTGLWIHAGILAVLSLIGAAIWSVVDRKRLNYRKIAYWFLVIVAYYLAFQLITYGFNKIFKWQFYQPEPNTLYNTVGNTPQDLLFWSTMGTSWGYNVFGGCMELVAGLLLIFKRTRLIGALVAMGIMVNVVAINLGFNISVKFFSSFLLFLSLLLVAPHLKRLWSFFVLNRPEIDRSWQPNYQRRAKLIRAAVKSLVIMLIFLDVLVPYFQSGNFNDDVASRPPFHGAWRVTAFENASPDSISEQSWEYCFVHREGYFIVQTEDRNMHDYALALDTVNNAFVLMDGDESSVIAFTPRNEENSWYLQGDFFGSPIEAIIKKENLDSLPLLQNEFNWVIDQCDN